MNIKYLDDLLENTGVIACHGELHREVLGIACDSRKVKEKSVFVAIDGFKQDGLGYLEDAVSRGAHTVVTQKQYDGRTAGFSDLTWLQVENDRVALSRLSSALYGNPAEKLFNIGITGTNGKTTVMNLIASILSLLAPTATVGTLGMDCGEIHYKTGLTTPESPDIFAFLAQALTIGCRNLVMETSSVALQLDRVRDIPFSQGIFTNFSGDHLDFHGTMDQYFSAKMILFQNLRAGAYAIVNLDDPRAGQILDFLSCLPITYGIDNKADVRPLSFSCSISGITARIATPAGELDVNCSLIGRVNLLNILAAVASCVAHEIPMETIARGIGNFKAVKGRLDVAYRGEFTVLIDYAHTDNALESLLKSLREVTEGRIIVVFGAGGARDRTKRPRMGKAVASFSDLAVVTSDNPRSEDPHQIIADVTAGFPRDFTHFIVEIDRKKAIERALTVAEKGDLVVIAGKGHEDYQIFKDRTIHFDDFEVVKELLNKDTRIENG